MYAGFKLDEAHFILKIFLILMAFVCLFLIPKVNIDYPTNCEIVIDQQNITEYQVNGSYKLDSISNSYTEYCGNQRNTPTTLMKLVFSFYSIITLYIIVYLIYFVFLKKKFGD